MSRRFNETQIAKRYASALFALAMDKRAEEAVLADLQAIKRAVLGSPEAAKLLAHPLVARARKAEALKVLLKAKGAHPLTQQALMVVAEAGRLPALPAIADAFAKQMHHVRGAVEATVVTARPLDAASEQFLVRGLEAASGKKVVLDLRQDASLIGGVKVKLGAMELDASISGKLARMKQALKAA